MTREHSRHRAGSGHGLRHPADSRRLGPTMNRTIATPIKTSRTDERPRGRRHAHRGQRHQPARRNRRYFESAGGSARRGESNNELTAEIKARDDREERLRAKPPSATRWSISRSIFPHDRQAWRHDQAHGAILRGNDRQERRARRFGRRRTPRYSGQRRRRRPTAPSSFWPPSRNQPSGRRVHRRGPPGCDRTNGSSAEMMRLSAAANRVGDVVNLISRIAARPIFWRSTPPLRRARGEAAAASRSWRRRSRVWPHRPARPRRTCRPDPEIQAATNQSVARSTISARSRGGADFGDHHQRVHEQDAATRTSPQRALRRRQRQLNVATPARWPTPCQTAPASRRWWRWPARSTRWPAGCTRIRTSWRGVWWPDGGA